MKNMTYRELKDLLDKFSDQKLDMNVVVYHADATEFYPVDVISFSTNENDVLDEGHPVLNLVCQE